MTSLWILNVGLFLPEVAAGFAASWLGWKLAGPDEGRGRGDGRHGKNRPPSPRWPSPVAPAGRAGPDDLARSA
jgi:hypothetical protein